jgi:hypothetical protein
MHDGNLVVFRLEAIRDEVRTVLGAAKDEHALVVGPFKDFEKEGEFLLLDNRVERMRHRFGGRLPATDFNGVWIVERRRCSSS